MTRHTRIAVFSIVGLLVVIGLVGKMSRLSKIAVITIFSIAILLGFVGNSQAARTKIAPDCINPNISLSTFNPDAIACSGSWEGNDFIGEVSAQFESDFSGITGQGAWSFEGKTSNSAGPFSNNPKGATGTLNLKTPQTGYFVIILKSSTRYSIYLFNGGAGGISSIDYSTAGTAVNSSNIPQDLSHASLYVFTPWASQEWNTPISLYATFGGKVDYAVIGASELTETNGYGNCQLSTSSSASLNLPGNAIVKSAFLYWYVMEKNVTSDNYPYNAISESVSVDFAGTPLTVTATHDSSASVAFDGGTAQYAGRFADVTALLSSSPSGTYTVDVTGGASVDACPYTEENVRGWSLIIVYEQQSNSAGQKIYVYDGMVGFVFSNIIAPVSNYNVPLLRTAGSISTISIQGDTGILGEYLTTTDTNFPDFPADFANSSNGAALDIDRLDGDFTAGSTSMDLDAGSNGDLILLANVVVSVPSEMDFGDGLGSYGNPAHIIPETITLYLGSTPPDDDVNTKFTAAADWDDNNGTDDEGGVVPPTTAWTTNQTETLAVEVNGTGYLSSWIDWNLDGDFDDPGEQIANEVAVVTGTNNISITVPGNAAAGNLPSRFRVCSQIGDCNTPNGLANDGEVEDYTISVASCTSLAGDISEIAAGIPFQVASGDKVFVASNSPLPNRAGHLKAYSVQTDGSIGSAVAWDAAILMDVAKRQNRLYSTDASGAKILFNNLDDAAFVAGATPTVAKIKEYTLDPSVDAGAYLAGRASGSWLGPMSRGNDIALLTQMNNMGQFLTDSAYRSFYNGTIASRSEKILVSSDDGFLYAFDQSTGDLSWAWMPRTLAAELKDYASFQSMGWMRGTVDIIDAKDSLGNYATYVVGGYKNGLGQYALKLDNNGNIDSVVWDQDYSASDSEAPNHGEKDYFRDGSGMTYVTYVVTSSSNQSTLVIRELTTAATNTEVAVNFNGTSTPYVMQDFDQSGAPAPKTLYLADDSGNIRRTALLVSGSVDSAANLKSALEAGTVGNFNAAEPVLFLGAAASNSGGLYFMRAQSESRLTLLQYNSGTTHWDKRWTSYVGGAGSWDASNTYTADNSGPPTDDDNDGFYTNVTANGIQSLPADARITDAARIVSNTVILPVSVQATGNCYGRAYYYLYNLTDGVFPDNKLMKLDSSQITGDIALGYGSPRSVNVSDMPSNELMVGHGMTDQTISNQVKISTSFYINDKLATGLRGWKERRQE